MTGFNLSFFRKKSVMIIFALIAAGLLLISLGTRESKKPEVESKEVFDEEKYTEKLENDAMEMINSVSGVKGCRVDITVECTYERVYASDGDDYLKIRNSSGDENALELTVNMPKVRGVAVVYKGVDSVKTKNEIVSLITALFDIPTNRVYVGIG